MGDVFTEAHAIRGTAGLPLVWRVHLLAMSRADRDGIARFDPGELLDVLQVGGKSARSQVSRAIKRAIEAEPALLDPGSTAQKLLLPYRLVGRGIPSKRARPRRRGPQFDSESQAGCLQESTPEHDAPSTDLVTNKTHLFVVDGCDSRTA